MSKEQFSKLYGACRGGEVDTVKTILPTLTLEEINHVEPNGSTALHSASRYGHKEIVQLLLSRCPNILIRNKYGNTAEEEAATPEIKALYESVSFSHELPIQGTSVFIFKNGYYLIVKKLEIPPNKDNAPFEIDDLPENPVYGTFSIQTTSNVSVSSIQTKKKPQEIQKNCLTIRDLIEANLNQENIELLVGDLESNPTWIKGKMQANSFDQDDEDLKNPTITPETMIIVEKTDVNLKLKFTRKLIKHSLQMYYENKTNSMGWAFVKYLTFGMTWIPSYDLALMTSKRSNMKTLRLSLKCVIINDIEHVQTENLTCVVGHPNLSKYIKVIDPLFSDMSVDGFSKEIAKHEHSSSSSTDNYSSNRHYNASSSSNSNVASLDDSDDEGTNDANNDFQLYQFHNVFLGKKEKLLLSAFDVEIPYRDLYRCKIDRTQELHKNSSSKDDSGEFTIAAEIWHAIEFENQSKHILTTAPVTIIQANYQFICQETLPFTLKNNSIVIPLTKAPRIQIKYEEKSLETQSATPSTVTIQKKKYVKEEWNGSLTVINTKNESVTVIIELRLYGDMSKYSVPPKIDAVRREQCTVNKLHNIRWDISLKPQQKQEINYFRVFLKQ